MDDDGSTQQSLLGVTIVNVDAYMTFRAKSQRRSSLRSLAANLRSFLRYLNATGRTKDDLSTTVIGPTLYAFESIPSVVRPEDIKMVVEKTRQDHSKRGRRDYAILMLLSSYGLRAGEITSLRLDARHFDRAHASLSARRIRQLPPATDLRRLFFYRLNRRVRRDCTFLLHNQYYEAPPQLTGETIEVRFDPLDAAEVEIHFQGKLQGAARLVDPVINAGLPPVKRATAAEPESTGINFVELLNRKKEEKE